MRQHGKTSYVLLAAFVALLAFFASGQTLSHDDLRPDPDGMPGERISKKKIDLGGGIVLDATITESTKGNGVLSIGNLRLRVIDEHNDGAIYEGGMAHVEFADVDGDGFKDLVVDGIVEYTDEKLETVRSRESFVFIYRFDPKRKEFKLAYKHASFSLEDGASAKP